ncbi:hypothetical protein GKC30_09410 [Pseudodesulfovibrio sp. F-1]|uniref:Tetratricopeptide repeat protein n=1 Tax=Pseudodesulfovibrio alkaliphilus TaxID=2661613 RepID=A0A7K1KPP4_9BACT|nr:hypothetical protein [Pseudodesulfovibrio alkaliphilus]MUM77851.1 hypothetical protein [Pseudodesulfovibrio alkaliphilus]
MGFFSNLTLPWRNPGRIGRTNFERGRRAELRGEFAMAEACFRQGAQAYDDHLVALARSGREPLPSALTMAGICHVRIGRNENGLRLLRRALKARDIPDAWLHAGYAAAKLGDREGAADLWSRYPPWADQPVIAKTLKALVEDIRNGATLDTACESVAKAVLAQDRENARKRPFLRHSRPVPPHRGY